MKVLVTGSSGFIGAALVNGLVADGETVAALDRRTSGFPPGIAAHYVCDLLDAERLRTNVQEFAPEVVLHLAARADLDSPDLAGYAANFDGVRNLLAAIEATPSVQRAVWTSTQLVCRPGHRPRDALDYCPHTLYGESKVLTEKIVREHDGAGREWCLVRPTTVWGPGMSAHYQRMLSMIARGRYFHVGRGPYFKTYGYIDNVVDQYRKLMRAPREQVHRRTFYVADYEPLDVVAWCDDLQRALGGPPIRHVPYALASLLARSGDLVNAVGFRAFPFNSFRMRNIVTEYQFDMTPTAAICGASPTIYQQGVAATAAWFTALSRS